MRTQVFVDLEGFTGLKKDHRRTSMRLSWLFSRLAPSLLTRGFEIDEIWTVANRKRVPEKKRRVISDLLQEHGASIEWCGGIADYVLIKEVRRRLQEGILTHTVVIFANDSDFAPLVRELVSEGYYVVVTGTEMSKAIREAGSEGLHLYRELLCCKRKRIV